jgi:hypothetical protein
MKKSIEGKLLYKVNNFQLQETKDNLSKAILELAKYNHE